MSVPALFSECVIPGCVNPVPAVGEPCGDCLRAFGPMLAPTPDVPRLTERQIAERDRYVRSAYAAQQFATGDRT